MNKLLSNRYISFSIIFALVILLNYSFLSSAELAYKAILTLSNAVLKNLGELIAELLFCIIGVVLMRRSAKYISLAMDSLYSNEVIIWSGILWLFLYCTLLFWGLYLILWSIAYIVSNIILHL